MGVFCFRGKVGDHTSVLAAEAAVAGGGFKDSRGGGVFAVDHVSAQITGEVGSLLLAACWLHSHGAAGVPCPLFSDVTMKVEQRYRRGERRGSRPFPMFRRKEGGRPIDRRERGESTRAAKVL